MDYDTMTPERLATWLAVGQESAPLNLRGGGQVSVARDANGYAMTVDLSAPGFPCKPRTATYADEHELFGALSAIGPWRSA